MEKTKLSTGKKIIIAVVAVILVLVIIGGGYCIGTSQNPAEAVQSVFSSSEDKLIGKWQNQSTPGLSAYIFYEDGTYDSYLSTVNFSGNYTVKGNKLTLINPDTNKEVSYKYSISGKELSLTLLESDGSETEINGEKDISKFDKVDELNMKSLSDLIGEVAGQSDDETTDETTEETSADE